MKGLWRLRSLKVQGSNNCLRLSALVSGHLVKTGTCPAMENNSLFLIGTFITLSRAYEASIWEMFSETHVCNNGGH
jgi:hypothetical protein